MKNNTVSYELCKQIFDSGAAIHSEMVWRAQETIGPGCEVGFDLFPENRNIKHYADHISDTGIPAFLPTDILSVLPAGCYAMNVNGKWVGIDEHGRISTDAIDNMPDALAVMLLNKVNK